MAYFIALTSHTGPLPADWLNRATPDPATFGLPAEDDGSRDDPLFGVNMLTLPPFIPEFAAVAAAPTRLVIALGEDSTGQMTACSAIAVAERLGTSAVVFPGGHGGFLGGELRPDRPTRRVRRHTSRRSQQTVIPTPRRRWDSNDRCPTTACPTSAHPPPEHSAP